MGTYDPDVAHLLGDLSLRVYFEEAETWHSVQKDPALGDTADEPGDLSFPAKHLLGLLEEESGLPGPYPGLKLLPNDFDYGTLKKDKAQSDGKGAFAGCLGICCAAPAQPAMEKPGKVVPEEQVEVPPGGNISLKHGFLRYSSDWLETNGLIMVNPEKRYITVVFRGTKSKRDMLTDLRVFPAALDVAGENYGKVHSGFLKSWLSVRGVLSVTLNKVLQTGQYDAVYFGGHSLGGALATLASFTTAVEIDKKSGSFADLSVRPKIGCYTFGSPKVGNELFTQKYVDYMTKFGEGGEKSISYRHVYEVDGIPLGPFGYTHVDNVVVVTKDGVRIYDSDFMRDCFRCLRNCETDIVERGRSHSMGRYVGGTRQNIAAYGWDVDKYKAVKLAGDKTCCGVPSFTPPGPSTMKAFLQQIPGAEGADDELAARVIGTMYILEREVGREWGLQELVYAYHLLTSQEVPKNIREYFTEASMATLYFLRHDPLMQGRSQKSTGEKVDKRLPFRDGYVTGDRFYAYIHDYLTRDVKEVTTLADACDCLGGNYHMMNKMPPIPDANVLADVKRKCEPFLSKAGLTADKAISLDEAVLVAILVDRQHGGGKK